VARYDIGVRECAECGLRLPRALPGAGRPLAYCSPACRQRAYRRRGGRSSGTTGAARRRQARQSPEASWPPGGPELKVTTLGGARHRTATSAGGCSAVSSCSA